MIYASRSKIFTYENIELNNYFSANKSVFVSFRTWSDTA